MDQEEVQEEEVQEGVTGGDRHAPPGVREKAFMYWKVWANLSANGLARDTPQVLSLSLSLSLSHTHTHTHYLSHSGFISRMAPQVLYLAYEDV